jgi:UPF0755 protein
MQKAVKGCATFMLFIFAISAVAIFLLYRDYRSSVTESGEPTKVVEFTIEEGETVDEIGQALLDAGLIENIWYFKIYVMQSEIGDKLQAGSFSIPHNLSLDELGELLQHAEFPDIWVTIPEGMMTTQVAEYLDEGFAINPENSFDKEEFLALATSTSPQISVDLPIPEDKPLEGFLYPDTYLFPPDATAGYVLNALLTNFRERVYVPHMQDIEASPYTLYEIVTLASILERETKHPDDRPLVADILLRRLENGWALEVDATLLYYFGDWTHVITQEDLQIDSPYNTRKVGGFTPTPIANPGEQTIRAVLSPEPNDYWYYISDTDGNLHYAVTLEEHNANIQKYLQ